MDDHATRRFLAAALGADPGVALQGQVDDAALVGVHGVEGVTLAARPDALREPLGELADLVLAACAVALDVEDEATSLALRGRRPSSG